MKYLLIIALCSAALTAAADKASPRIVESDYTEAQDGALLQNPAMTPGDVLTTDAAKVCKRGYAKSVRNVPSAEKRSVYTEYHTKVHRPACCEVDHLISLELGGSNDISNLWPQPYTPKPGAHEKDLVEQYLHWRVCKDKSMTLPEAQQLIRTDWTLALPGAEEHYYGQ